MTIMKNSDRADMFVINFLMGYLLKLRRARRTARKKKGEGLQMIVRISKDGQQGTISYSQETKQFQVEFPHPDIIAQITEFLSTEREFKIPESQRIDDYRIDIVLPTENKMYFNLTFCELYANTGVYVTCEE